MSVVRDIRDFFARRKTKEIAPVEGSVVEGRQDWQLLNTGRQFTRDTLNSYLSAAEQGDWRMLHTLFDEMRARDPGLETKLSIAERLVSGAPMTYLPYPPSLRKRSETPEGEAAVAANVARWVTGVMGDPDAGVERAVRFMMSGYWKGIAALEVVIVPGLDGKERIGGLFPIPSQRLRYAPGTMQLLIQRTDDYNSAVPIESYGSSLIVFTPEDHVWNPGRWGLLRRLIGIWLIRVYVPSWWSKGAEQFFNPIRVGKYPKDDKLTRDLLVHALDEMGANAHIVIPNEAGLEMPNVQLAKGADSPHQTLIDWADREQAKLIIGATQPVDVQAGAGSQNSANIQQDTMLMLARSRAHEIATCLRRQLIRPLVASAFGEDVAQKYTPEMMINVEPPPDLLKLATSLKMLFDSGAGEGVPISIIYQGGQVPVPEPGEPTLGIKPLAPGTPGDPTPPSKKAEEGAPATDGGKPDGKKRVPPPIPQPEKKAAGAN